jgi:hypothetical protein
MITEEDHKLKPSKKIPYDSRPHKIFESLLVTATETEKKWLCNNYNSQKCMTNVSTSVR